MEKEVFNGHVIDVGFENHGIIYDLCKKTDDNLSIDYVEGKGEKKRIQENFYDSCVIFFSVKDIYTTLGKKKFFKDIFRYLKKDGYLYLWDIDKGYNRIFDRNIKIVLSDNKIKKMAIKDYKIFTDNSAVTIARILEEYFEIIDLKCSDNIYYIKAKKISDSKGSKK
jgi:hypothetical protein